MLYWSSLFGQDAPWLDIGLALFFLRIYWTPTKRSRSVNTPKKNTEN